MKDLNGMNMNNDMEDDLNLDDLKDFKSTFKFSELEEYLDESKMQKYDTFFSSSTGDGIRMNEGDSGFNSLNVGHQFWGGTPDWYWQNPNQEKQNIPWQLQNPQPYQPIDNSIFEIFGEKKKIVEMIKKITEGGKKQLIFSLKSDDELEKEIAHLLLAFLKIWTAKPKDDGECEQPVTE